jgi:hypothetical protein
MGWSGSTPAIGSVMKSWWRTGIRGSVMPAPAATRAAQPPAASTTAGARISPRGVTTPVARPLSWSRPCTGVNGSRRAPSSPARVAKPIATFAGSSQPSLGTWRIERAAPGLKCGASRSASAASISRASMPQVRAVSCAMRTRSTAASVYAARRLPERWKPTGRPISLSKRSKARHASSRSRAIVGIVSALLVSPAARGEVCEPSACWSTSATARPRRAR